MSNKVYVVIFDCYEDYTDTADCRTQIEGVFSTKEKAEKYCKQQISNLLKEYHDNDETDWHLNKKFDNCITDNYTQLTYYWKEYELDKIGG